MKKILVSLVSDQTIPNILAISVFKPDELLFISTKEMEEKSKTSHIVNTLKLMGQNYEGKTETVKILEDSILDAHKKLEEWIKGREDFAFIINITCGTKIMSIAAYEYFKDFGSKIIYLNIDRNEFITPFPNRVVSPEHIDIRFKVKDYLSAHGLTVVNTGEKSENKELSKWIMEHYDQVKKILDWLSEVIGKHRDDKIFPLEGEYLFASKEEEDFLQKLNFKISDNLLSKLLTKSDIRYLTGGWLEEYCFNELLDLKGFGIDDVALGISIKNEKGNNNEFDIMFTKENALFTIECKSLDQDREKLQNALYKLGALNKEFGLRKVKSFLVTTSPEVLKEGKIRDSFQARSAQFNTKIISPDQVINFKEIIKSELKI